MSRLPRPLLTFRLIGPADVVTAHEADLLAHLAAMFGERAIRRSSTHPASYAKKIRVYVTVGRRRCNRDDQE
jgi:hypothetical protein